MNIKYPANPRTIGELLRKRRYDLHLTQAQVAKFIGVTGDSITYWENERSYPQVQYYKKIMDFLGFNPFEFEIRTWGDKLKHFRFINGLTQKALGMMIGIDPSTIATWEKNLSMPNNQKKIKMEMIIQASDLPNV